MKNYFTKKDVRELIDDSYDGNIVIPEGITVIDIGAFEGCTSLTSLTIPDSVVEIYDHAFEGCTALESVVINKDILIDYCAFLKCNRLQLTDKIEKTYMEMCGCCGKDINTRKDACLKIITNYGYDHYMCSTCGTRNENLDKHCLVCECSACIDNRGWARCLDCRIDDPEYGRNIPDDYAVGTEWINT